MPKTIFGRAHARLVTVLAETRRAAGLKQADLASLLSRHQTHISLIENNQRRVDVIEFIELARAMGADPVKLLTKVIQEVDEVD